MEECTVFEPEGEVILEETFTLIQSERFKKIERDCAFKGFSDLFEEKMKVKVSKVSPDHWMDEGLLCGFEEGSDEDFSIEESE